MNAGAPARAQGFRIRHTMLRVCDLEKSVDFYTRLLGMGVMRRRADDQRKQTVCYVGYGDEDASHALELVCEHERRDRFEMGNCYGHVALAVPDLRALCEVLAKDGVTITHAPEPVRPGSANLVAFVTDPDGYEIELTERH